MNKNLLQLEPDQPLSGHWNTVILSCILGGNNVYDSCIPHGRFLGILEAIPFVACSIREVDLNELPGKVMLTAVLQYPISSPATLKRATTLLPS